MKLQMLLFVLVFHSFNSMAQLQIGSDIDGESAGDNCGWSVSLSADGSRMAIGASRNNGTGNNSGHVRVFELSGGNWTQLGNDIDGEAAFDLSGSSVSFSSDGSRIAIGAYNNDGTASNAGHARVFEWDGGSWIQIGADIDGEATSDRSGYDVSLSSDGSRVAIGAYSNDGNGSNSGHVRVYELNGGNWIQLGADIDGEAAGDNSGYSVSLTSDGTRVAIGAYLNDGNGSNSGHARVYEYSGGNWTQLGVDIDGEAAGDNSGYSLSLSSDGNYIAIGAYGNDDNGISSGHVRVYEYSGGGWIQIGSDIDGENAVSRSGYSVSLSSDGSRVAIGGDQNSGNGSNSGHVRVFELNGGNWTQLGVDIDGEAAGDRSGFAVSLSSNGTYLAVGAPYNSGNGIEAGHVRVFDLDAPLPVEIVYFKGKATQAGNLLTWATASEFNNDRFIVEYSNDGRFFYSIGEVLGNGSSSIRREYEFSHTQLIGNTHYYRLKQVDYNSFFEYSDIISIITESNKVTLYPNPTTGIVEINGLDENAIIEISDSFGQRVNGASLNKNQLNLSNLSHGVYFVKFINKGQSEIIMVLKE